MPRGTICIRLRKFHHVNRGLDTVMHFYAIVACMYAQTSLVSFPFLSHSYSRENWYESWYTKWRSINTNNERDSSLRKTNPRSDKVNGKKLEEKAYRGHGSLDSCEQIPSLIYILMDLNWNLLVERGRKRTVEINCTARGYIACPFKVLFIFFITYCCRGPQSARRILDDLLLTRHDATPCFFRPRDQGDCKLLIILRQLPILTAGDRSFRFLLDWVKNSVSHFVYLAFT